MDAPFKLTLSFFHQNDGPIEKPRFITSRQVCTLDHLKLGKKERKVGEKRRKIGKKTQKLNKKIKFLYGQELKCALEG